MIRNRLTYANVMSTLAFVLAFGGGTAYATHLVVMSDDIVDGQVMNPDLADSAVNGAKVAGSSLTGSDVANGSLTGSDVASSSLTGTQVGADTLTGSDIFESSLDRVPSATTATLVNGVRFRKVRFLVGSNTGTQTIFDSGVGLRLTGQCTSGGDLEVRALTDRNARMISASMDGESETVDNGLDVESFTSNTSWRLVGEDDGDQSGQTTYMSNGGNSVTIDWAADNDTSGTFGFQCAFVGVAAIY